MLFKTPLPPFTKGGIRLESPEADAGGLEHVQGVDAELREEQHWFITGLQVATAGPRFQGTVGTATKNWRSLGEHCKCKCLFCRDNLLSLSGVWRQFGSVAQHLSSSTAFERGMKGVWSFCKTSCMKICCDDLDLRHFLPGRVIRRRVKVDSENLAP